MTDILVADEFVGTKEIGGYSLQLDLDNACDYVDWVFPWLPFSSNDFLSTWGWFIACLVFSWQLGSLIAMENSLKEFLKNLF